MSIRTDLNELCHEYRVDILYAFGSRANEVMRGVEKDSEIQQIDSSDVDIAVKLKPGSKMSVRQKAELAMRLEDLLGGGRVDLVSLSDADPFLAVNIIRGKRLFSVNERTADEYDLYILRRAGDLAPFERRRMASVLAR
jgi:predicted nucleotidyltransferase